MPATEASSSRKSRLPRSPSKPAPKSGPRPVSPGDTAPAPSVVVRKSGIQGRGVFAVRPIAKGELIVEYLGRRMTHDEVGNTFDDEASRRHHTFLFSVDDELCIDGAQGGNEARLINHSCAPNAFAEIKSRRIFIRAERAIEPGEEVVYDYWYSTDPDYTLADLKRIYPCRCGAAKCRGTLAAPPEKVKKVNPKKPSAGKASKVSKVSAAGKNGRGVTKGKSAKAKSSGGTKGKSLSRRGAR